MGENILMVGTYMRIPWYLHENTFSLKMDSKLCDLYNCKYNDCELFPGY